MTRFFWFAAQATALFVLSILTRRLWRNLQFLRRVRGCSLLPAVPPKVSMLVPARNEAQNIVGCIESLARQDYPNIEVIALNDQSTDETGRLLDDLATQYTDVTVIHGSENPPDGWNGKSYACQRLAVHATGDWLLFTDADTLHMPDSIAQGIAQAETLNADLLSAFPRQITTGWSEQIIVSFILDFLPLVGADLPNLSRGTSRGIAANGQYLLVRAAAYRAVGGHAAIAQALVDDFALAKRFRSCGYRVALVDGTSMLSCRMYRGAGEVWAGFSKNIILALERSPDQKRPMWQSIIFAWGYACVFVLPFILLFSGRPWLPLIEIGWLGVLRLMVNREFSRSVTEVLTTPLAGWSVMALGMNAWVRRRRGVSIRWKGRAYSALH